MKIVKHLQKPKKQIGCDKEAEDVSDFTETCLDNSVSEVSEEYFRSDCGRSLDIDSMMTSTPVRLNRLKKIIILHHVSHLKIYEDFDEIDNFDISAVTLYEEGDEVELSFDESGFKIYENIGESFAVD